jgi:uncharacterized membrane protein YkvA (DUF1232 family)
MENNIPNEPNWKMGKRLVRIGRSIVYRTLLFYYAFGRKETPRWLKAIFLGILGYFISFVDFIPDFLPWIGYTDDIGLIILALIWLNFYIDDRVKTKAQLKMNIWFGTTGSESEGMKADLHGNTKESKS